MSGPAHDPRYWFRSGSGWFQNQGPKGWFRWFPPKGGGTRNQLNRPLRSETRYRNQLAHGTPNSTVMSEVSCEPRVTIVVRRVADQAKLDRLLAILDAMLDSSTAPSKVGSMPRARNSRRRSAASSAQRRAPVRMRQPRRCSP